MSWGSGVDRRGLDGEGSPPLHGSGGPEGSDAGVRMTREQLRLLVILGICAMTGAMAIRIPDPVVPLIAGHFAVAITTAALLATAFALPYGLFQPILGPLGDALGKTRVLRFCMVVLLVSLVAGAMAPTIEILFVTRIVAGIAGGGLIPLAIATIGDHFEGPARQIALSRLIAAATVGTLVGLTSSGLIAEAFGWRGPFWMAAIVALPATLAVVLNVGDGKTAATAGFSLAGMREGYRRVFRNPRAPVCYAAVFLEGVAIYGVFPFVAEIIQDRGAGGSAEAGFVIAGLGLGGITFSALVGVLLRRFSTYGLMVGGGILAGAGLFGFSLPATWPFSAASFFVIGLGFFALHNGLQTRAVGLAPEARGSAVALHAFFFFLGQALAPVLLGPFLHGPGVSATLTVCAVAMALTGVGAAWLLRHFDRRDEAASPGKGP
jgi:predicted MFS family arabinose efflux permease